MNTFLARTGSNSTCFLAIKQSLPCGCVQFRGGGACAGSAPPPPPRSTTELQGASFCCFVYYRARAHVLLCTTPITLPSPPSE